MFNKNGNNNGNGSANGVHKDTCRRGQERQRAQARRRHPRRARAALGRALARRHPGARTAPRPRAGLPAQGARRQFYDYLEGHAVIDQANRIFGYGGWGYELVGDVTLRQVETVDPQTGEVKVSLGYSAPVRVTVAGALPRTDTGVHPVTEDNLDGHDTAMKGAVTDGMKRAFRSFGVQFGNGFYGDQAPRSAPQPERVATQAKANGKPAQAMSNDRSESQAEMLRRRLFEIAAEQGLDEDQVRSAVVDRMGKSIDDLTAAELGPLVEAAANKLRQIQQAQAA